jgi:hypothetical protein
MFNFKKVHFTKVNDFLYKEFEELFFPIEEMLSTKDAANFKLSNKAVTAILYELFFFFIYTIYTTEQYKNDEYLKDLFKRFSSFFKPPLKLEINEYTKRFSEIDEVMKVAVTHAQNSGGIGGAIIGFILYNLPDSILDEITITRDDELEKMFGVEVEDGKNNDIFIYLPMLTGVLFGEMNIRFAKDIENYFKKHKIL